MTTDIGAEADDGGATLGSPAGLVDRLPGMSVAAVASIGAGLIHAGAIGMQADHATLARLFIAVAVFQLGFGVAALIRPSRRLAAIGAAGSFLAVGAWLTTRLVGVSWIGGLEARQTARFADTSCALLGLVAGGLALSAVLVGWHRAPALGTLRGLVAPALAVAALAIPAMFSGANDERTLTLSTAAAAAAASTAPALPPGATANADGTVTLDAETTATIADSVAHIHNADGTAILDAATAATLVIGAAAPVTSAAATAAASADATATTLDESQPHVHNADETVAVTTAADARPPSVGAAIDPVIGIPVDDSQAHVHAAAVVAPVPYDPTLPIDLGGVPGVTPQEQAKAENLVAITLIRLPQWSDPATAVAAGFHSIGDGFTGFEHYINWDWINDDDVLDPDHPESLVYSPQPDGTMQLVSAMFMLPDTVALTDVPDIGGALTQWHIHDNLCFTRDPVAPQVAGITDGVGNCPASLQAFRPAPMIHVWITPNKCGPFAALEGVGAGQVADGQTRSCDHVHGSTGLLG